MDKGFFRCNSFWNIGYPLGSVVSTTTGAGGGDGDTLWGRGQEWGQGHSLGQGPGWGALSGARLGVGALSGTGGGGRGLK